MVVKLPTGEDLDGMRAVGRAVAGTIEQMRCALRPGITTLQLDVIGRQALAASGARSAPELVYGFPAATCVSVNDEAAHGIPGDREVRDGDLVNIDVSAELGGYYADAGASAPTRSGPSVRKPRRIARVSITATSSPPESTNR